jgi:hypothetical protein
MTGPADLSRWVRQTMLVEVGERGQRALSAADARVLGPTFAHEVAALYARGAGFGSTSEGEIDAAVSAPSEIVETPEAAAVLAGARAALEEIRRALRGA